MLVLLCPSACQASHSKSISQPQPFSNVRRKSSLCHGCKQTGQCVQGANVTALICCRVMTWGRWWWWNAFSTDAFFSLFALHPDVQTHLNLMPSHWLRSNQLCPHSVKILWSTFSIYCFLSCCSALSVWGNGNQGWSQLLNSFTARIPLKVPLRALSEWLQTFNIAVLICCDIRSKLTFQF